MYWTPTSCPSNYLKFEVSLKSDFRTSSLQKSRLIHNLHKARIFSNIYWELCEHIHPLHKEYRRSEESIAFPGSPHVFMLNFWNWTLSFPTILLTSRNKTKKARIMTRNGKKEWLRQCEEHFQEHSLSNGILEKFSTTFWCAKKMIGCGSMPGSNRHWFLLEIPSSFSELSNARDYVNRTDDNGEFGGGIKSPAKAFVGYVSSAWVIDRHWWHSLRLLARCWLLWAARLSRWIFWRWDS